MLASRCLSAALLIVASLAVAADEELPEIEFLEYLGLWEETDEDWLMFSDPISADNKADDIADHKDQQRSEPVPEGEESMEKSDES